MMPTATSLPTSGRGVECPRHGASEIRLGPMVPLPDSSFDADVLFALGGQATRSGEWAPRSASPPTARHGGPVSLDAPAHRRRPRNGRCHTRGPQPRARRAQAISSASPGLSAPKCRGFESRLPLHFPLEARSHRSADRRRGQPLCRSSALSWRRGTRAPGRPTACEPSSVLRAPRVRSGRTPFERRSTSHPPPPRCDARCSPS